MDYQEIEDEEKAKRKKAQVEFRTKKRYSLKFQILASIFEIIETVIIMFSLIILSAYLAFGVFHINQESTVLIQIGVIFIFLLGMVLGFIVYKKVIRWYIRKFKKMNKLNDEILVHYFKDDELAKMREGTK